MGVVLLLRCCILRCCWGTWWIYIFPIWHKRGILTIHLCFLFFGLIYPDIQCCRVVLVGRKNASNTREKFIKHTRIGFCTVSSRFIRCIFYQFMLIKHAFQNFTLLCGLYALSFRFVRSIWQSGDKAVFDVTDLVLVIVLSRIGCHRWYARQAGLYLLLILYLLWFTWPQCVWLDHYTLVILVLGQNNLVLLPKVFIMQYDFATGLDCSIIEGLALSACLRPTHWCSSLLHEQLRVQTGGSLHIERLWLRLVNSFISIICVSHFNRV